MPRRKRTKKQEETLERMKKNRQIDSNNLRDIIKGKLDWAVKEKEKGERTKKNIEIQLHRLDGIILFIKDLFEPPESDDNNKNEL